MCVQMVYSVLVSDKQTVLVINLMRECVLNKEVDCKKCVCVVSFVKVSSF